MFIDTANVHEIKEMLDFNLFEGVTTNPALLLKERQPRLQQIEAILNLQPSVLFVQLVGDTRDDLVADYHQLKQAFPDTGDTTLAIKVPLFKPGYQAIAAIREEDSSQCLLGTSVYSVRQGFMGCVVDCDYVAPYVNRMRQLDIDPYAVIRQIHDFYKTTDTHIKIMGASFNSARQVMDALAAGVDNVTISYQIFQQLMTNTAAEEAIRVFNDQADELNNLTK